MTMTHMIYLVVYMELNAINIPRDNLSQTTTKGNRLKAESHYSVLHSISERPLGAIRHLKEEK